MADTTIKVTISWSEIFLGLLEWLLDRAERVWNSTLVQIVLVIALVISMWGVVYGLIYGLISWFNYMETNTCNQLSEQYPQYNFKVYNDSCKVQLAHGAWILSGSVSYPNEDLKLK